MSTKFDQKRTFKKRHPRRENRDSIDTNNTSQIALYYPTKDEEEEHKEAEEYLTLADLKRIGNNPNQYMEYNQYKNNYSYGVDHNNHPDHSHSVQVPTLLYHSSNLFVKREDTEATLESIDDYDYDDDDDEDDDEDEEEDDEEDDEDDDEEEEEDDDYTVITETTTATYKDLHSRHVSDDFVVSYHENIDTLPAILETINIKINDKKKTDKKTMKRQTKSNEAENDDVLYLSSPPSIPSMYGDDNNNKFKKPKLKLVNTSRSNMITPVQHNDNDDIVIKTESISTSYSHSPHIRLHDTPYTNNTYTINTINTKYSPRTQHIVGTPSLHLVQSDSNNVCLIPNVLGFDDDELDPDVYDLLSESICNFFKKVDTKRSGAVSSDIIKICFNLLDINLTDNQYIMFFNELTNFRSNKLITLDMLRCFLLNIQNKCYSHSLNHIRLQIMDILLSQPTHSTTPIVMNKMNKMNKPRNKSSHKKSKSSIKSSMKSVKSSRSTTPTRHGKTYSLSTFPSIQSSKSKQLKSIPSTPIHSRPPPQHQHNHTHAHNIKHNIKKIKSTKSYRHNNNKYNNSKIWRPHITDHDENGEYQYDLLLCTLKYSLISSAMNLYHTDLLGINYDKFYVYTANKAQKQALQYLFESFFDFMGNYTEFLSLKQFEAGLKNCGITVDRQDIVSIAFQQLSSSSFTGYKPRKHKTNTNQLFVTKISFIAWIIGTVYNYTNINYQNYVKHYHQYYKWIESDLFSLINKKYDNKNKNKNKDKPSTLSLNKPLKIPQVHSARRHSNYHDKNNNNNNNNNYRNNGRHKSHQYYNPVVTPQKFHSYNNKKLPPVPPNNKSNKKNKRSQHRHHNNKNNTDKLFG